MEKPQFDSFAKDYSQVLGDAMPPGLNEDGYFAEYKIALMARRLQGRGVQRILDFGCGAGRSLPYLRKHFPSSEIWGYDVSSDSLAVASEHSPDATLASDWAALAGTPFDVILAANVFHHIPPADRPDALALCRGALREGGQMFLFEHNPYNPVTRWIFERCAFDVDAQMLASSAAVALSTRAGFAVQRTGYTLFFPRPLAFLRGLESWLEKVPVGAQYYVQLAR